MKKHTLVVFISLLLVSSCSVSKHAAQNAAVVSGNPGFLFISDIHLDLSSDSTKDGDDTGTLLWKIFLTKVDSLLSGNNAPRFAIYTGDLPAHDTTKGPLPPDKKKKHDRDIAAALTGLRDLVTKHHTPFFYVPGNNDALTGNYFSFADENNNTVFSLIDESANPYPALNINRDGNIAPCMVSNTHPAMGYYSARPADSLRIIALNTVIFTKGFQTADGTTQLKDGNDQLDWLEAELKDAAIKGDKVYIAMHVPPGIDAYRFYKKKKNYYMWDDSFEDIQGPWLNRFLNDVDKNRNIIAGILFGHTHMDEIRRLYDSTGKNITAVAVSAPAISANHNNNPGFKIVQYDRQSKDLLDFTTYYTNPAAAVWGNASYSFNDIFGFSAGNTLYKNVSTASFDHIGKKMTKIFTVMHDSFEYASYGIEVKFIK